MSKKSLFYDLELFERSSGNIMIYDNKANKFTMKLLYITVSIFTFMWILNVLHIFIVDNRIMDMGLVGLMVLLFVTAITVKIIGYENPIAKYVLVTFGLCIYGFVTALLTYHAVFVILLPLVCSIQYRDRRLLIYTYILTLLTVYISTMWGFKNGLCDANMLLLTRTFTSVHAQEYLAGNIEINNNMMTIFMFFILPKWMIISGFIPLVSHITEAIKIQTLNEIKAQYRAEFDDMTGLYNKNKYLVMVEEYYPKLARVGVIYWDLNDLKLVNDTFGHEWGDKLIMMMAESITGMQSYRNRCYRLGGDEFVMLVDDPQVGDIEKILDEWVHNIEGKTIQNKIKLTAAVGYAQGDGKRIELLIQEADALMYENKKKLKEEKKS